MKYVYVIERGDDGTFSAYVPDLPGCYASGDTLDELRANLAEGIQLHIESLREHNEPVPPPGSAVGTIEAA